MCCEMRTSPFLDAWTWWCCLSGKFTAPWVKSWRCLRSTVLSSESLTVAGPGQQAQPSLELSDYWHHRLSPHGMGFHLSPLLSQTHTVTIATFTLVYLLPLWQSGIHLCLKCLKFSLGTKNIWSSGEIVWRFPLLHRILVQAANFSVPFKISRHERSIGLNFLRE